MTFLEAIGYVVSGLVILYMAARFIFAAWFKTRNDFERKDDGKE